MPQKHRATTSAKSLRTYLYPFIGIVLLLAIIFLVYYQRHSVTITDATTHKAQPYTELYFAKPDQLPSVITNGRSLPISFSIHNLEGHAVTYDYVITFTIAQGRTTTVRRQSVMVASGQSVTVHQDAVALPAYQGRAEIGVVLLHYPETIHFWVVDQPAATGANG